ncbi:hypothetical protein CPC197_0056A, partial [Chlamydia psittaci C1/97]
MLGFNNIEAWIFPASIIDAKRFKAYNP